MTKDEKQPGIVLPNTSVVLAAIFATGAYWFAQEEPLRGSRPLETEAAILEEAGTHKIEARLWQDPILAVAAWRDKHEKDVADDNCGRNAPSSRCRSPLHDTSGTSRALGISLSGARYPQSGEARRRTRYAVLAGLNRAGFVPEDPQHIDYFMFQPKRDGSPASVIVAPYEWFRSAHEDQDMRVLVFWLDEDMLGEKPLTAFEELADFLSRRGTGSEEAERIDFKVAIIGPEWSGTLRAMAKEACGKKTESDDCVPPLDHWPGLENVSFYTFSASAPDEQVLKGLAVTGVDVPYFFRLHGGIELHRVLAPDDLLADMIKQELKRRGVDPALNPDHHIALITEWDTLYGQTFPETVKRSLFGDAFEQFSEPVREFRNTQVHELRYLRGLDGHLPDAGTKDDRADDRKGSKSVEATQTERNRAAADAKDLERPDGRSQFDYLRRLAGQLHQIDNDLRLERKGGIEAIGVLGSDVFDKLLVLRALRPRFPEAIFFTTDLDLGLTLRRELDWSRNLIVASGFGLQLHDTMQREIPPFRSAFQTGAFLATLLAMHEDVPAVRKAGLPAITDLVKENGRWVSRARLFEIDRAGDVIAFEDVGKGSTGVHSPRQDRATSRSEAEPDEGDERKIEIHPSVPSPYPQFERFSIPYWFVFTAMMVAIGLALRFVEPLRRCAVSFLNAAKSTPGMVERGLLPIALILAATVLSTEAVAAVWRAGAAWLTGFGQGEPLILLQGASVWPTILLRLLGSGLSAWFIWRAARQLDVNLRSIARDLAIYDEDIDKAIEKAIEDEEKADASRGPWERFSRMFSYMILRPSRRRNAQADEPDKRYNIDLAWRTYIYQERFAARAWRVAAWLSGSTALVVVILWNDWTDHARGDLAQHAYFLATYLDLLLVTTLVVFVFDATLFFWFFVNEVRDHATEWPEGSRRFWQDKIRADPQFVDDWIDLEFIARRTKCIAHLVYYPFVVIALTVLSCSTALAHFPASLPFLVIQGAGLLIVSGCAVALRLAAESARGTVKRKLSDEVAKEADRQRGDRLQVLMNRVEGLHEGAFRPWIEQPVVRALLWPIGTFGAAAFLDHITALGL